MVQKVARTEEAVVVAKAGGQKVDLEGARVWAAVEVVAQAKKMEVAKDLLVKQVAGLKAAVGSKAVVEMGVGHHTCMRKTPVKMQVTPGAYAEVVRAEEDLSR